ncbi:dTDP-4-dehydrorhamnose 3,5-epimerase [Christensenella hongkongensis]|uniref:dTDP-4-dehydrorhamnose 3,5-epimerase n=1 Tax=Christensenella hongkongensis TaxID=270498 RepID=A0A0M2NKT3_9FIRM|nr:dTDP-4-dehydrorhamnose 3,5-epimerase [Christensenella hongkongensis]KKI50860.1 dTDP-4-dehydrorhamnose 3,5-epimerase [Christensenella hongkongensis]TCW30878.1 dTDP-4-dehydrorhamnose 3,5-epimerase [Christensenella hongkongensis]
MKTIETGIEGLVVIEPDCHGDHRGWFMETYSKPKFEELGITCEFVQDNQSFSAQKGTLRGLHFQIEPMAQSKLLRCTRGKILDVAVDLRKNSPTYKKWYSIELSAENKLQFFMPAGMAHGFVTLTDDVEVQYKVDKVYAPECDRSVRFDDPEIDVDWGIAEPILSEKDLKAPLLKDSDANF